MFTVEDTRIDYGEQRFQTVGFLAGRMVMVVWTPRGETVHVMSMRNAMAKNKHAIRSDLKKVDAHVIQPDEYDDAPELTNAQLASATVSIGIRPRGRPKSARRKEAISLRVDADVLDAFKSTGEGWQTRMNGILRAAILPARKLSRGDKGKSKLRRA